MALPNPTKWGAATEIASPRRIEAVEQTANPLVVNQAFVSTGADLTFWPCCRWLDYADPRADPQRNRCNIVNLQTNERRSAGTVNAT